MDYHGYDVQDPDNESVEEESKYSDDCEHYVVSLECCYDSKDETCDWDNR